MKIFQLVVGIVLILVSIGWIITQDGSLEPYTVALAAVFSVLGFFLALNSNVNSAKQTNLFSAINKMTVNRFSGKGRQFNFFGFGNSMKIDGAQKKPKADKKKGKQPGDN